MYRNTPHHTSESSNTALLVKNHTKSAADEVAEKMITAQNIAQFTLNNDPRTCEINLIEIYVTSDNLAKFWSRVSIFVCEFEIR